METPDHSNVCRARNVMRSVIHGRSPVALMAAFAAIEIKSLTLGFTLFGRHVPIIEFERPRTKELTHKIRRWSAFYNDAVIQN